MEESISASAGGQPRATRLVMPKYYQAATEGEGLLQWSRVVERLERAQNYWLATTRPDGRPHVTPIWGAWVNRALYFDGIFTARWARNMAVNSAISAHLESGTDVVIVDGVGDDAVPTSEVATQIVAAWTAKYGRLVPDPTKGMYRLTPRVIRAWTRLPHDATRWTF